MVTLSLNLIKMSTIPILDAYKFGKIFSQISIRKGVGVRWGGGGGRHPLPWIGYTINVEYEEYEGRLYILVRWILLEITVISKLFSEEESYDIIGIPNEITEK